MARAKKADAAPQPENPGDARLLANYERVHAAIKGGSLSCVIGVAVTQEGDMIDMFGTAGNHLFECAALVQLDNLQENMRGMQNRRMVQQQQAAQQAALDAAASIHQKPANDSKPKRGRKPRVAKSE